MKKRKVTRRGNPSKAASRRVNDGTRPGVVFGVIVAVVVLVALGNWLYRTGAFAATADRTEAQIFTDATALIAQSNSDIQAVTQQYEQALADQASEYQAQIDELNDRIEKAISEDSISELTSDVGGSAAGAPVLPGADDDLPLGAPIIPSGDEDLPLAKSGGFWYRVGQFFANLFN